MPLDYIMFVLIRKGRGKAEALALLKETEESWKRIRALKVQGAGNIAEEALSALNREVQNSRAKSARALLAEMHRTIVFFKKARPTEPALRNTLRFVYSNAKNSGKTEVSELKKLVAEETRENRERMRKAKEAIAAYGAKLVPARGKVLVHCHSGAVMAVLKKARDKGKKPKVFCTETRPLLQGRISAAELKRHGLDVTLLVDSAARFAINSMSEGDLVLVGADAVTASGGIVNKIGTSQIALAAKKRGIRVYCCTGTHKFDPITMFGESEPIEERGAEEVVSKAEAKKLGLSKVKVMNPAFDFTEPELVDGIVTEMGIIPPNAILPALSKKFGLFE